MYRLTNSFPYLLNRVGVRIGELFSARIAAYGVTLPMYRVLAALWEKPGQRLSDLSAITTIEISTLSRLVGNMTRRGLISRSRLEDNGRTVTISLTVRGGKMTEKLIPIAVHFEDIAVRNRSVDEVRWIKSVLAEAYNSLNEIQAEVSERQLSPQRRRSARGRK